MSIALKLEKTVSATPEAPRTRAFRLGLVAPAHALRDAPITQEPSTNRQVFKELQSCVLFEWARQEKSATGYDFLELARHLQGKATHVWPRKTLGEPPIPKDACGFKQKLERHLGGSRRTNIATHRLRAETLLIKHLAWMPSTMPPPSVPMTQFFGGQTQCVNSGTLSALQRKGRAPRPAKPKPSPPPPPTSENSPGRCAADAPQRHPRQRRRSHAPAGRAPSPPLAPRRRQPASVCDGGRGRLSPRGR